MTYHFRLRVHWHLPMSLSRSLTPLLLGLAVCRAAVYETFNQLPPGLAYDFVIVGGTPCNDLFHT
jgi:hypothetical protein